VLSQVEAATEAARRVAHPAKPCFSMGFLTGHELTWMPEALQILRDELPNIDVMISSQYSPLLADGLSKGKSMRPFFDGNEGRQTWRSAFSSRSPWWWSCLVTTVSLRSRPSVPGSSSETFVTVSDTAPVLRVVIDDDYLKALRNQYHPRSRGGPPRHGYVLNSIDARARPVACYAQNFLPSSVTSRPLRGDTPTIDLVLGYKKSNKSPILKLLLRDWTSWSHVRQITTR